MQNCPAPWLRGLVLLHAGQATERAPMRDPQVATAIRGRGLHTRAPSSASPASPRHRPVLPLPDPGEGQLMDTKQLDDDAPEAIVTCTGGAPRITHELLTGIRPGDLLREPGTLIQPPTPGEPARITIDALEVLDTVLVPAIGNCCYQNRRNAVS
ncbi:MULTISPECIES: hypothetical protein [unclassified Streptomyces]|uniref:hypothetical protein n=1 Tax=unclassified Streptomyces TaxID=2593676 RepID=UPI00365DAC37